MTDEETIFYMTLYKRRLEASVSSDMDEDIKAFDTAIKALEQQPCEDAVSRQAVHDLIAELLSDYLHDEDREKIEELDVKIEDLPSVTPKEKTGRWISFGIQGEIDGQIVRAFTCSKCGAISIFRVSNGNIVNGDLCPNCGAKMVEPQESEDKK